MADEAILRIVLQGAGAAARTAGGSPASSTGAPTPPPAGSTSPTPANANLTRSIEAAAKDLDLFRAKLRQEADPRTLPPVRLPGPPEKPFVPFLKDEPGPAGGGATGGQGGGFSPTIARAAKEQQRRDEREAEIREYRMENDPEFRAREEKKQQDKEDREERRRERENEARDRRLEREQRRRDREEEKKDKKLQADIDRMNKEGDRKDAQKEREEKRKDRAEELEARRMEREIERESNEEARVAEQAEREEERRRRDAEAEADRQFAQKERDRKELEKNERDFERGKEKLEQQELARGKQVEKQLLAEDKAKEEEEEEQLKRGKQVERQLEKEDKEKQGGILGALDPFRGVLGGLFGAKVGGVLDAAKALGTGGAEGAGGLAGLAGPVGMGVAIDQAVKSAVKGAMTASREILTGFARTGESPAETINQLSGAVSNFGEKIPVLGVAISAVGEVGKTIAGLMQEFTRTAERYAEYNPIIAQQLAMSELRQVMGDMNRAMRSGPELARFVREQSEMQQKFEELKVQIWMKILPILNSILSAVNGILGNQQQQMNDNEDLSLDPTMLLIQGGVQIPEL